MLAIGTWCCATLATDQPGHGPADGTAKSVLAPSTSPVSALHSVNLGVPSGPNSGTSFTRLTPRQTGLDLVHEFPPTGSVELLQDQGAAAGICVGDFDGDGLPDVFVTNYDRGNRLYRNLGDWRFEDVSGKAGIAAPGRWCGGATAIDLDNDGDLDLCVCVFNGSNLVFINQGDGTFSEEARARGLDFAGASVMMAFADYNLDGNPDVYLLTHRLSIGSDSRLPRNSEESFSRALVLLGPDRQPKVNPRYAELFELMDKGNSRMELFIAGQPDHLLRNLGQGRFTDVSARAGIRGNEIGLAATWWDYDQDGLPDVYVSNDYKGPDRLYRNHGDGSFTDVAREALPHVPWSSMGADAADLNNDGRTDFLAAEMAGSTRRRRQLILDDLRERWFLRTALPRQYPRNAVYLATGTERLMEIAFLTGLAGTDWTWAPKFADLDNDGWVDLFIANGMSRDFLNADLLGSMRERGHPGWKKTPMLREANLAFRNLGDLRFQSVGREWGLDQASASFSAALSDLDRDGDLDLIVMNLGEPLSVYRNDVQSGRRVLLRLKGTRSNAWGLDAIVHAKTPSGTQTRHLSLASGFMSANEPLVHFGLGDCDHIRRLTIRWPSGHEQSFENLEADRFYTVTEPATTPPPRRLPEPLPALFRKSEAVAGIRHREQDFDDFEREPLLPWKLSQLGPGLAVGDVDADCLEDLYLGGAAGYCGQLCTRKTGERFQIRPQECFTRDQASEDMGALFFDADSDGDLDLYVVSGGVECAPGSAVLRDRLYLNDGRGDFSRAPEDALPDRRDSGSVVAATDFDRDGDLDLFVGGRCVPGSYPVPADSQLLRNDRGRFSDVTDHAAPGLRQTGLVTSAVWSDANDDGWLDLLVTHEWGPVKLLVHERGQLVDRTREAGLADRLGWWNSIAAGDVDNDGDTDYVVGNLGLNTRYRATPEKPVLAFLDDFDGSGQRHLLEAIYEDDTLVPLRSLNALSAAIPSWSERFPSVKDFAGTSLADLVTGPRLHAAKRFAVNTLESGVLLNDGQAHFTFRPLPRLAQVAPIFGLALTDVDADGRLDLFLVHNFFSPQPETGRMDGGLSLLLRGNGDGTFAPVWPRESGLLVAGDAKSLAVTDLNSDGWPDFVVGLNDSTLQAFENITSPQNRRIHVELLGKAGNPTGLGARVRVTLASGAVRVSESQAGGGYLSQSTRVLGFGLGPTDRPTRIQVRWAQGHTSSVSPLPEQTSINVME